MLHPGFALVGPDLAGELARSDGPHHPGAGRTVRVTAWWLAVALAVVVLVITSQLGALEGMPGLRQVRTGIAAA